MRSMSASLMCMSESTWIRVGRKCLTTTRGLLLWRVTGGQHAANELAENYYGAFIKLAQKGGKVQSRPPVL